MLNTCKSNVKQELALVESGARVSNTWVMCPLAWNNSAKAELIPNKLAIPSGTVRKGLPPKDQPASHQLVGRVMAYQGIDG